MTFFFAIIVTLSFLLTWIVRKIAIRRSILDVPNDRSSHVLPTPRGGGIAVAIAWYCGVIYIFWIGKIEKNLFYALLSGIPLTLVGFTDDLYNLKPGIRFLVQFICAATALFFLGGLNKFPLGTFLFQYGWLLTIVAFIAIIWSANLFNFLDGIDGYISLEILFIGLAMFFLTRELLGLLLAASVTGFLCWNWQKAKIFMGDVGSTFLGFTIAVLAIYHQNRMILSLPVWMILTSVFWFDATVTLIRRIKNKESLSQAHRKHAYQRIVQWGFSHQKTTLCSLAVNIVGLGFAWLANDFAEFNYIFLLIDLLFLFIILRWIDRRKPFEYNRKDTTLLSGI